jgi:two-component system phosphate regulon response regulator PhoB
MQPTVLVIEDEAATRQLLNDVLMRNGLDVIVAEDGPPGLEIAHTQKPDLVLLDLRLPTLSGLDVLRRLRTDAATATTPVIILTAEDTDADIVVGLELGADDYVTKPFSPRVLVARVRSVLRRAQTASTSQETSIAHGELLIDPARHVVTYAGQPVVLTATEFRILQFLVARAGTVTSRQEISAAVREGDADALDRTVDAHIKAIRRKLGAGGALIETVRGFGYKVG